MNKTFRFCVAVAALAVAAVGRSQVLEYDVHRSQDFSQTSDAQPTTPYSFDIFARIFTTNPGDATDATMTAPDSTDYAMTQVGPTEMQYIDSSSPSEAAEEATYPNGTYQLTVTGGAQSGASGLVTLPSNDFPDTVPYLTGTGYDSLQNMDTTQDHALDWGSFGHSGNADTLFTFFNIYDGATGAVVYSKNGADGAYTGDTILAGSLQAGHSYEYAIFYSCLFTGSSGVPFIQSGCQYSTNGFFTTAAVPEPASLAILSVGLTALRRKRRR